MADNTEWVLLDTETDGLYEPVHIVEVAAQRMIGTEPAGEMFHIFINHDVPIPAEALAIHGYTREFLTRNGVEPRAAHKELGNYIGDRLISSHYLAFDWERCLLPEWWRLGIVPRGHKGMCMWFLARTMTDSPAAIVESRRFQLF